jgi:SAM-dependent methyltransferase
MTLSDLIKRCPTPTPWDEGEKIPWDEPGFSARMLREHLSQAHNAASRRFDIIDRHVAWIHATVLAERPTRILDLGCGPGFYVHRLAALGHECRGIDFSPASIAYAEHTAQDQALACSFEHGDIRTADYHTGYSLVMLIFGELNVFTPADAERILTKAWNALTPGGAILLEPHTFSAVQTLGQAPNTWYSSSSGLFAEQPHLCLQENFWDPERAAATMRYLLIDAANAEVTRYASSMQAYTHNQYRQLLASCGFPESEIFPSLLGVADAQHQELLAIVGRKRM